MATAAEKAAAAAEKASKAAGDKAKRVEPEHEYEVTSVIHRNGHRYDVGDTIELTEAEAAAMPDAVKAK